MKKIKYVGFSLLTFMLSFPVLACSKEETKCGSICVPNKLPNTVHIIILTLQIAVPVLLVIFGMIDLIKAIVAGKEDEIKKAQGVFIRRLITGVLVFFVIVIVQFVFNLAADGDKDKKTIWTCAQHFINGV